MPLKPGKGKNILSANIAELLRSGTTKDPKQAAAIAYSNARKHPKKEYAEPRPHTVVTKKENAVPRKAGIFSRIKDGVTVYKDTSSGFRYLFLVTSNSYEDRDKETIRTKALQQYVDSAWTVEGRCLPGNPLYLWHDGEPIGDIVWADMEGPFLLEVAKERRDKPIRLTTKGTVWTSTIKSVWDVLEQTDRALRWGASHGFRATADDTGTFDRIKKFETSVLPLQKAANLLTYAGVVDDMNKDKVLENILNMPGFAGKFRKGMRTVKSELDKVGLAHKQADETHVKGVLDDLDAVFADFAEQLGGADQATLVQELKEAVLEALTKGPHSEPDEDNAGADNYTDVSGEGATLDDVRPAASQASMMTAKQYKLFERLTGSLEALTDDGAEMREALLTVAKAVNPLTDVPKGLTALEARLAKIEKQLGGKPRRASVDVDTVVSDPDLTKAAKALADTYEELFPGTGVMVRKEAGNGAKGGSK